MPSPDETNNQRSPPWTHSLYLLFAKQLPLLLLQLLHSLLFVEQPPLLHVPIRISL